MAADMGFNCNSFRQMRLIRFPVVHTPEILEKKKHDTTLHFQGPQPIAPSGLTLRWINYCINGTVTDAK